MLTSEHWLPAPLPALPTALATNGRRVWAALADGTLYASDDAGASWVAAPAGNIGTEALSLLATPHALFAATEHGVFRASHKAQWERASTGLPDDEIVTALDRGGSALVAGTLSSGAFRSSNGGKQWAPANTGLPFSNNLALFALSSTRTTVYAAHPLGLSRSTDKGFSWSDASSGLPPSVLLSTVFAGRPMWASGGGSIFRSAGGRQWSGVYTPGENGPLVLIARAAGTLIARAAEGTALYASRDGGITWHPFSTGLPAHAFATHGVCVQQTMLISMVPDGVWRCRIGRPRTVPPPLELLPGTDLPHGAVAFRLRAAARVVLSVHDMTGAELTRLTEGEHGSGLHCFSLDDDFPSGFYEWRLSEARGSQARSFVLLR